MNFFFLNFQSIHSLIYLTQYLKLSEKWSNQKYPMGSSHNGAISKGTVQNIEKIGIFQNPLAAKGLFDYD